MVTPFAQAASVQPSGPASASIRIRPVLEWLAGCSLAALLLSISASYAPAPVKKLGLFFILCGGLTGLVIRFISRECGVTSIRRLRLAGFLFALAVLLNISWLSLRSFQHDARAALESSPEAKLAQTFVNQPEADPETREAFRRRYEPGFADYLAIRVSALGHWPFPWPMVFWVIELSAGAVCGGWISGRSSGRT